MLWSLLDDFLGMAGRAESDRRAVRLAALQKAQNGDGGWGYAAGRQSWLEPTCYSLFALLSEPSAAASVERGWKLLRSWQLADGGWRPGAGIAGPAWTTALCVSLHCARQSFDEPFARGLGWLLRTTGNEGSLLERVLCLIQKPPNSFDRNLKGWPWLPDSASWVEPTSHALVAVKLAARHIGRAEVRKALGSAWEKRVEDAERMLLDRRSVDGGWNYGNRRVLETNLPSYPETTGLALLGLQGSSRLDVKPVLEIAAKQWRETESPLARAWLEIALRNSGVSPEGRESVPPPQDNLITALEAMACPQGGHQWLKI